MEEKLLFKDTFIIFLIDESKQFDLRKSFNHTGKKYDGLQNLHHISVWACHLITCGRDFPKHKHGTPAHNNSNFPFSGMGKYLLVSW